MCKEPFLHFQTRCLSETRLSSYSGMSKDVHMWKPLIFASSGNYFKTARLEESLVLEQPVPEDTADVCMLPKYMSLRH